MKLALILRKECSFTHSETVDCESSRLVGEMFQGLEIPAPTLDPIGNSWNLGSALEKSVSLN